MKRFWDTATTVAEDGGYAVHLDGRAMRIPGGPKLIVPGRALADALAAEWQQAGTAKGGTLSMAEVPLTRLAGTAQDRIAPDPGPVAAALAAYAETDLLCYRAAHPVALAERQARVWQPWLDWLARTYGARLEPTEGIVHRPQDPDALARIRDAYASRTPGALAALGIAVPALGSAVLGLALADGALSAEDAHVIAALDELFEAEEWGDDPEAEARREAVRTDLVLAARFLHLDAEP